MFNVQTCSQWKKHDFWPQLNIAQMKRHYGTNEIYPHGLQTQWKRHGFTKDYF